MSNALMPNAKVAAGGVGGVTLGPLVVWLWGLAQPEATMPVEVAAIIGAIVASVVAYFKRLADRPAGGAGAATAVSVAVLALLLTGCAAQAQKVRTVQKQVHAEKVTTMGILLDTACDGLLVTDVRDAMRARPYLRAGLPLVCPDSVGALMGLAAEGPPSTVTLKIEMVESGAAAE